MASGRVSMRSRLQLFLAELLPVGRQCHAIDSWLGIGHFRIALNDVSLAGYVGEAPLRQHNSVPVRVFRPCRVDRDKHVVQPGETRFLS